MDKIFSLCRGSDHGDDQPRLYEAPVLKFNDKSYTEMIDWKRETVYEPVPTVKMSKSELLSLNKSSLSLPKYPSNTQSVERFVKQISRAASSVAVYEATDGFLRASATFRQLLPKFDSNQDFENNLVYKVLPHIMLKIFKELL